MKRIWMLVGLALALFAAGVTAGWKMRGPEVTKANAATAEAKVALVTAQANATARVEAVEKEAMENARQADAKVQEALARVQVRIKEVNHEVPVYIPAQVDQSYPLSNGFVFVLNQAARYPGRATTPEPSCESPGTPSPVTASRAASTLIDWAGLYYAECERVKAWQQFYKALQKSFNGDGEKNARDRTN